jgi:hypothetical protein
LRHGAAQLADGESESDDGAEIDSSALPTRHDSIGKSMKALLLTGFACAAMLLTGCHTVAVVDDHHGYAHSGYHGHGYYSNSSPYYSGYHSRGHVYHGGGDGYYGSGYHRSGYYGDRAYSRYPSRSGATVVIH